MSRNILIALSLLFANIALAKQSINLAPIDLEVNASNVQAKFEQAILYPEGMLNRYQPVGAKISKKQVSKNEIDFIATKKFLFISKSVHVNGTIDSRVDLQACKSEDLGYRLNMRLDLSDKVVSNNVEEMQAIICLNVHSNSKLTGNVNPVIRLGSNYSRTLGPIAINLIKEQVSPLLEALKDEINSMR